MYSKPPTIPFGIVACTFSGNPSRNSCMYYEETMKQTNTGVLATDNVHFRHEGDIMLENFSSRLFLVYRCIPRFRQSDCFLIATRKFEIRYDELAEPVYLYRDSLGNVLDSLSWMVKLEWCDKGVLINPLTNSLFFNISFLQRLAKSLKAKQTTW